MPVIYEWPRDWYRFTTNSFRLQSRSQTTARSWIGGKSVYGPHAQLWVARMTLNTEKWDDRGQTIAAFISRLDGQAGLLRIGHYHRLKPQYNRLNSGGSQPWSDSTLFDDGTGWVSGLVPPFAFVLAAASRGDNALQIGGLLPVSTSRVLRRGDLLEIRPNGIASDGPNLYEVQVDGNTNADGETGVEIRPRLRQNLAAGDQVVLQNATSVFRLIDDEQGAADISAPGSLTSAGFSLVEAIV